MHLFVSWLAVIVGCGAAQWNAVDPGVEPKAIVAALHSDDSRTVAWGAWRALHVRDRSIHEEVGKALLRLDPGKESDKEAILAVFHSIIDLKLSLPADMLYRYFEQYPAGAVIALAHSKLDTGILSLVGTKGMDDLYWTALAEIASRARVPGIARVLLDGFIAEGFLSVTEDYDGQHWSGVPAAILGSMLETSRNDTDTWPPLFVYSLASSGEPGDILLIPGPIPIYARRMREGVRRSGGVPIEPGIVRQRVLLALGTSFAESVSSYEDEYRHQQISRCPAYLSMSMTLGSRSDFLQRFSKLHQDRRQGCDRMIEALRRMGALSPTDEVFIPIRWTVQDARRARGELVPDLSKIADVTYLGGTGK